MAMCDGSMGHRRLAPWAMCDGSMGHVRRLHGPQAAGKLPCTCTTTLSSLDAADVTRRRRRETSFAFPSGGARQRARLPTVQKTPVARFDLHRSVGSLSQVRTPRCLGPTPPECLGHLTDTCSITQTTTSHPAYSCYRRHCCCRRGRQSPPPHASRRLGQWQRWPPRALPPPHHRRPPCCRRPDRTITRREQCPVMRAAMK